jgi:uncharacterized protein YqjF (DUF2071 family)
MATAFLTAQWRFMAMLNFEVDPEILLPRVPAGTQLDLYDGKALVSVVGFFFRDARILGVPVPLHREFEEVNLRYYVRREAPDGVRHGVTFVKEIVPRWAVAQTARLIYNENFTALPMRHDFELDGDTLRDGGAINYGWRIGPRWYRLRARSQGKPYHPEKGSEEEFVISHWYGYTPQNTRSCLEFYVDHPPWRILKVSDALLETEVTKLYGAEFKTALNAPPRSAFICEGSPVTVFSSELVAAPGEQPAAVPASLATQEMSYAG